VNHLGHWLSALVDGELDGVERDKVLNHIAGCSACRQEANAMRALKRRLTALGDSCAEPPITGRLIEMAKGDEEIAAGMSSGSTSWSVAAFDPPPGRGARQIRPGWKIATGSATSALLAIGVSAFLLGNGSGGSPVPKITPSVDSYLTQHIFDAGQQPAGSTRATRPATAGGQAGAQYWTHQVTSARLDPRNPQTVRFGVLAEPARSVAGSTASAGSMASASASASPSTSVSASPAATAPASHVRSPHKQPASRSTK
jgi:hypothetical protein